MLPNIGDAFGNLGSISTGIMDWVNKITTMGNIDVMGIIAFVFAVGCIAISIAGAIEEKNRYKVKR